MPTQRLAMRFEFDGAYGDRLAGLLELPVGKPQAFALFAHCFTCSKDTFAAARISRALAERGIAVLRFDFTGLGSSEGDFANTNFSSNVQDLIAATAALSEKFQPPRLLIGHSLGGAAVLAAALDCPTVEAVVTLGAPADPRHVLHNFAEGEAEIRAKGEAAITLAGREFTIRKQFLDDVEEHRLAERIHGFQKPLLVLHSPSDEIVEIDNGEAIFAAAAYPKSFISLDGANHLLTKREDSAYVAGLIEAWAARVLKLRAATGPEDKAASAETTDNIFVAETGEGKFTNVIYSGRHVLVGDEPEHVGGDDRGPNPYEYLLAALGTCTSMTLRLYADRKDLPLDRVSVRLRHTKVHAEDRTGAKTTGGKIDRLEREIFIDGGDLTPEQRQRLLEIADKCPVHRTLEQGPDIVTKSGGG